MSGNPYMVLGLQPGASDEEIKKQYRTLVKQYHPDLHPDDPEAAKKMSEINEAYEMIKAGDDGSQQQYYQRSSSAPSGTYSQGGTQYQYQYADFEDVFRAFFGGFSYQTQQEFINIDEAYIRAENYVSTGEYNRAAAILNKISAHDGRWYYFASLVSDGLDNYHNAVEYADHAAGLSPQNSQYVSNAALMHKKYDKLIRRARFFPRLLSFVTMMLVLSFIMRLFGGIFSWFF